MAQGFKLVLRPSKPGEKDSEKKFYAVSKTNGTSSMKTLCKLISARSTVSSADVKAVLDNLNFVLDMELQEGRIVRLGDFGSFRISVSSDGVTDKKDFNTSMLRPPRIIFTPGGELKDTKKTLEYARVSQDGATTEAGGSDSDSPDEIKRATGNGRAALRDRPYLGVLWFLGGSFR